MRANSSDPQDTVTATQPIKAGVALAGSISKYRQPIGLAVTLLLFAIALIACRHLLSELDLYALHDSILEVPKPALLGALGATVAGFIILLGYEWSASRYAGVSPGTANPGTGRLHRLRHRQCHRSFNAVRRLGSLPPVCAPWPGGH